MKKFIALASAIILILSISAGCKTDESQPTGGPTTSTPTASSQPAETGTPDLSGAAKSVIEGGEFLLPLVDSPVTFTAYNPWDISASSMTDSNDSYAYQEAEKRTGIKIRWFHPAAADAEANFNLSIASGDYYDTYMVSSSYFTNGLDAFVDDEIVLDLSELVEKYAPNYNYVRNQSDTLITTVTDAGNLAGFWQIAKTYQWAFLGPLGRTDWLKELNMDMPETYNQLHDVLVAFRDQMGAEIPLSLGDTGIDDWLLAGFDTMYSNFGGNFIQKNGTVSFGPMEPGFKEYVTMMYEWYSEGLIDRDFYTRTTNPAFDTAFAANDKVGVGQSLYTFPDFMPIFASTPGYEFNAFRVPVKNVGDTRKLAIGGAPLTLNKGLIGVISTACNDPITLTKWYDYFYTEEGSLLANYGIEDQGFSYDDQGNPKATELVYADKEGRMMNYMFPIYAFNQFHPFWYDWEREISPVTSQNVYDTKDLWDGNWEDQYSMPSVAPTTAESAEYAAIINDINTLISENIVRFITGEQPLSEFDSFINRIKSMNIDRAIEIQQAALDRYNNRLK